ncbi:MAG: hypothetical protein AAGA85_04745 [Bacteroidota bacterium]
MKQFLAIYLVHFSLVSLAQPIEEIRKTFHHALLHPEETEAYHDYIQAFEGDHPAIIAYQAIGKVMMAKEHWNPVMKLSYVKQYDALITEAIQIAPDNLEIRFLRFAVEYELPKILMMSDHLLEDRDFIVANMHNAHELDLDPGFTRYISWFMNHTGLLEPDQLTLMETSLSYPTTEGASR